MQPLVDLTGYDPTQSPPSEAELLWRSRYTVLEAHGYRLRQRYKPDWVPSWLNSKRDLVLHDDYKPHNNPEVIDAIRIADGRRVCLKRIPGDSSELEIHRFLWAEERRKDERNHTVPILDEFAEDDDPRYVYIVMPFLRPYDFPEFFSVDEVVEFIKQILEGLVYMHKLNVAHRDCSDLNVMMDATSMYPKGFHPKNLHMDGTGTRFTTPKHRRDAVPPVRYYFIDFGISTKFDPEDKDRTVLGVDGQDHQVPELSIIEPYDPFFVDIYILGNLFKTAFIDVYDNLEFLKYLAEDMMHLRPRSRFTAEEALNYLKHMVARQPAHSLRWRLKKKRFGRAERFFVDVDSICHEGVYLVKRAITSTPGATLHFFRRRLRFTGKC